uniref:Uncharacterized protein n=1 Tax=Arundo donax TaxID=35708 RepID=A0A0A8XYM6_ARUDO
MRATCHMHSSFSLCSAFTSDLLVVLYYSLYTRLPVVCVCLPVSNRR